MVLAVRLRLRKRCHSDWEASVKCLFDSRYREKVICHLCACSISNSLFPHLLRMETLWGGGVSICICLRKDLNWSNRFQNAVFRDGIRGGINFKHQTFSIPSARSLLDELRELSMLDDGEGHGGYRRDFVGWGGGFLYLLPLSSLERLSWNLTVLFVVWSDVTWKVFLSLPDVDLLISVWRQQLQLQTTEYMRWNMVSSIDRYFSRCRC